MTEQGYRDGDRVRDVRDGSTGTVTALADGWTEIRWDHSAVADELAEHIIPFLTRL